MPSRRYSASEVSSTYHNSSSTSSKPSASAARRKLGMVVSRKRKSSAAECMCCPCGFKDTQLGDASKTYICYGTDFSHLACSGCLDKSTGRCKYHPQGNVVETPGMWQSILRALPQIWSPMFSLIRYTDEPYDTFVARVIVEDHPIRLSSQNTFPSFKAAIDALQIVSTSHVALGNKMKTTICGESVFINFSADANKVIAKVTLSLGGRRRYIIVDFIVYLPEKDEQYILRLGCPTLQWHDSVKIKNPCGGGPKKTQHAFLDLPEPPPDPSTSCSVIMQILPKKTAESASKLEPAQ